MAFQGWQWEAVMRAWAMVAVLSAVLAAPVSGQAVPDERAVAVAERFLGLLRSSDWAGAGALISEQVPSGRLGAPQLELVWQQVRGGVGELKSTRLHRVATTDSLKAVELLGQFERQLLLLRVVIGRDEKVAGFWLGPAPADTTAAGAAGAAEVPVAAYVDRTRFTETELVLGVEPWQLGATLTVPAGGGRHPGVVLVHGSGPHDRDETIGPNRPFRDLAWGLGSAGVAVLRYEKRTKAHGARMATATLEDEVVTDALAALELMRNQPWVDPTRVYLLGHSLGAQLAPEIARRDGRVAGVVLLAAPARPLVELLQAQLEHLRGLPLNASAEAQARLGAMLAEVRRLSAPETPDTATVLGVTASYFRDLARRDPLAEARKLEVPLLVLQGEGDYQVTMADYQLWVEAMHGRRNVTLRSFPSLNHLFMAGSGQSSPAEYAEPGHVAAEVIETIREWIRR